MSENLYWPVYKNLERELVNLSELIHIDDSQLMVYSVKISELLIRTVVEVESIVKELYFLNGGSKLDDKDLFFDTDCIELLESNWELGKKTVLVSAANFYFIDENNKVLKPLYKSNKRGSSSSDWQKAYQAIKHNRAKNLSKGNLKNLIRALAGLFILNIYYKNNVFNLEKNNTGTNFDESLGSSIFSIKVHLNKGVSIEKEYEKKDGFEECIYLIKPTNETRIVVRQEMKVFNDKVQEKISLNLLAEIQKVSSENISLNNEETISNFKDTIDKLRGDYTIQVANESGFKIKQAMDGLKYEAILNTNQY